MAPKNFLRLGLAIFLIWSAAACSSATPTPAPTDTPEPPTATLEPPTDTPVPTDTPAPTLSVTDEAATSAAATPSQAAQATAGNASVADHEAYVGQSMADGTQLRPGIPMIITWTVKNDGATEWSAEYTLDYFTGVEGTAKSVKIGKKVAPGAQASVSVTFTTPTVPGDYRTWWKFSNLQGQHFGDVDFAFTVTTTPHKVTPTP
jgi:hypothetical protein